MEYTAIPTIMNRVSRLGLGTWAMGGSLWGESDEQESINTIHRALDLGINLIDTAPGYGFGVSEKIIGKALKQHSKKNDVILATKFGLNLERHDHVFRDSRRSSILNEIDASLRHLEVDSISLYQVHWPDPHTPQSETALVLKELLQKGKIQAIGVCNYSIEQIEEFRKVAPIHAVQFPFNLFERECEHTVLDYANHEKLGSLGYSSLCRGLLTGILKQDFEFEELRKNFDPKFRKPLFSQYLICVGRLEQWVLDKYQRPLASLAIRWSLDKGVKIALWGARKPEELDPLESILGWKLSDDDFKEIDQIIDETIKEHVGPQFMSPPERKKEE
jgi:aryl-alcohol dehydrogenase-like predicted oxidoreductase